VLSARRAAKSGATAPLASVAALHLHIARFRIEAPGFCTEEITLVATLRDAKAYPDAEPAELCFRDGRLRFP